MYRGRALVCPKPIPIMRGDVMLVDNTLFGTVDKVQIAIDRIRQFEPPEGYYVTFSGGKDSIVVKDLVKRSGVKADYHYNITTIDPPELVQFIKSYHPEVQRHHPEETMWQLIARKGDLPTRLRRWCCSVLKEGRGAGRIIITGIRWAESNRRSKRQMAETCMTDNSKRFIHPIIDWSEEDIWNYIRGNNVAYCSLYDHGYKRLGCLLCPMVSNPDVVKRQIEEYPKIYESYRRACQKGFPVMLERDRRKNRPHRFQTWEEWFNWWLWERRGTENEDPDQTVMFE